MTAEQQLWEVLPAVSGPLLCHFDGKQLNCYPFSVVLRKVLNTLNATPFGYNSLNLRIRAVAWAGQSNLFFISPELCSM